MITILCVYGAAMSDNHTLRIRASGVGNHTLRHCLSLVSSALCRVVPITILSR